MRTDLLLLPLGIASWVLARRVRHAAALGPALVGRKSRNSTPGGYAGGCYVAGKLHLSHQPGPPNTTPISLRICPQNRLAGQLRTLPRLHRVTPAALADLVRSVARDVLADRGLDAAVLPPAVTVQRPRNPEHGDYATNLALQTAKSAGLAPREFAAWLAEEISRADGVASAEVAGPGFLNLRLAADAQAEIVREVLAAGQRYGNGDTLAGRQVNLEFVRADPTDPWQLGGARAAAVGDALARILAAVGAEVISREHHAGAQIADIARFADKRARGLDLCIYLLGADHHGCIGRRGVVAAALGDGPTTVEVLVAQPVNLIRDGVLAMTSKPTGIGASLADLVDAVGVDAARYALLRTSYASPLDLDIELWSKRAEDNPVFSVQYAHARLCSLDRNAVDLAVTHPPTGQGADLGLLTADREGELIRTIGEFGSVVAAAAALREPHRVARYLEQLASAYHRFSDTCRVLPVGNEPAGALHAARLQLCAATRQVLANGLDLLGVHTPERM